MAEFTRSFLLVFGQLAIGGMIALAVPPFAILERGFYKSSAGIFLGCGALFVLGRVTLALRHTGLSPADVVELTLWSLFVIATALYLRSLWGEAGRPRARAYAASLLVGLVALAASAEAYRLGPLLSPATVLYPLAFLTAALTLGAVATGMLLGHWYLIDLGLSIEPMRRLFRFFVTVLIAHIVVLAASLAILAFAPDPAPAAVATVVHEYGWVLAGRFVLGPVATLALGWMIHRTLQIPQTMAATGLFYIAILFVMVGEILGRLLLFRTSLPL